MGKKNYDYSIIDGIQLIELPLDMPYLPLHRPIPVIRIVT
jgi:hypothetical protein